MAEGLVISTLAPLLLSNCGGGGSQEEAAEEQEAPVDALEAALEKSFEERAAPGVVAAVQTPEYTWGYAPLGWRTALPRSR